MPVSFWMLTLTLVPEAAAFACSGGASREGVPELTTLCQWLEQQRVAVLPKSPIGHAVQTLRPTTGRALTLYTQHGFLAIDNNAAERAPRPIAVGRNNWLFVGRARGGQTAAILFSFTSTCRRLNLDPFAYLRDVLACLAAGPLSAEELALLLPHHWTPPAPVSPARSPLTPECAGVCSADGYAFRRARGADREILEQIAPTKNSVATPHILYTNHCVTAYSQIVVQPHTPDPSAAGTEIIFTECHRHIQTINHSAENFDTRVLWWAQYCSGPRFVEMCWHICGDIK